MTATLLGLYLLVVKCGLLISLTLVISFWLTFEIWLIGSFFWAYIDEHRWFLPKPLERIFVKFWSLFDAKSEAKGWIDSINDKNWLGNNENEPLGGRICLTTTGLICRIFISAFIVGIACVVWPIGIICLVFWLSLRSLRFLRRQQKTIGKIIGYVHKHKATGEPVAVEINKPRF